MWSLVPRCGVAFAVALAVAGAQPLGRGAGGGRRGEDTGSASPFPKASGPRTSHDRRPRCDAYMQRHWAVAGGGFLTRDRGRWHLRADGSRVYDVDTCRLVRFGAEDARRCLRGRHVFFIGDSVTRYQTMSLVHFLERGAWPERLPLSAPRCNAKSSAPKQACGTTPNLCVEGDWRNGTVRNWPNMLAQIGGSGDGGVFRGRVECLCARDEMETTVQNVLYRSARSVNVTFLEQTGHPIVHGWQASGCADKGACRYTPDQHELNVARSRAGDYAWSEPLASALDGPLPRSYPDATDVIYNRGLWGLLDEARAAEIFPRLKRWADGPHKRCFWKGTTSAGGRLRLDERATRLQATRAGCDVFDLQHVTQAFDEFAFSHPKPPDSPYNNRERDDIWWDAVHFMPWVYEEINNLLLNVLCNADPTWDRATPRPKGPLGHD